MLHVTLSPLSQHRHPDAPESWVMTIPTSRNHQLPDQAFFGPCRPELEITPLQPRTGSGNLRGMTRLHDYTSLGAHYEKTQMCPLRQGKSLFQISDHSGHLKIVRQTRCRQLRQAECNSKDTRSVPVLMLQTMPRSHHHISTA